MMTDIMMSSVRAKQYETAVCYCVLCIVQMNYARYFYTEYFPDLHGSVIHIDDDCIVQGKHCSSLISEICNALCRDLFQQLRNVQFLCDSVTYIGGLTLGTSQRLD